MMKDLYGMNKIYRNRFLLLRNSFCLYVIWAIDGVNCSHSIRSNPIQTNPIIAQSTEQSEKVAKFLSTAQNCKDERAVRLVSF